MSDIRCRDCATHDGWHIEYNLKPIPDRRHDYDFWHEDYDGVKDGNHLAGTAESIPDAMDQITEMTGRA
jgi:hypothetical protein